MALPRLPVYVIVGQSNAEGFADNAGLPATPVDLTVGEPLENVYSLVAPIGGFFWWLTAAVGSTPLGAISTNKSTAAAATFGPEMSFASKMTTTYHPGKPFAVLKYALNASSLYHNLNDNFDVAAGDENNWSPLGARRAAFIQRITQAQNGLATVGAALDVRGFLVHQGEADAIFGDTLAKFDAAIDDYEANCLAWYDFLRDTITDADLTTHSGPIPICHALINFDWYAEVPDPYQGGVAYSAFLAGNKYTRLQGIERVRAAQTRVQATMDRVYSVDTIGLATNGPGDEIHLNHLGQIQHGNDYADAMHMFFRNERSRSFALQGISTKKEQGTAPMRPIHVQLQTSAVQHTVLAYNTNLGGGSRVYLPELAGSAEVQVAITNKVMDDAAEVSVTSTGGFTGRLVLPAGQWDLLFNPTIVNPSGGSAPVQLFITQGDGFVVLAKSPNTAVPASSNATPMVRAIAVLDEETEIAFQVLERDASAAGLTIAANQPCGHARKIGNAFEN